VDVLAIATGGPVALTRPGSANQPPVVPRARAREGEGVSWPHGADASTETDRRKCQTLLPLRQSRGKSQAIRPPVAQNGLTMYKSIVITNRRLSRRPTRDWLATAGRSCRRG
jgi:hypothetical protein